MAPHCSTLAWKIPWTGEPGGLPSMGSHRVGHDWAPSLSLFTFMHWRRKWQPTPVFLSENSHGPEPGRLQSKGPQRAGHDWSDLAAAAAASDLARTGWALGLGSSLTYIQDCSLESLLLGSAPSTECSSVSMRKTDIYFWHWGDPKQRQLESRGKVFLVKVMQPHDVGLVLCPQTKTRLELWSQRDRPWQTEQADLKPT